MLFAEEDINYNILSPKTFEELCFDLLLRFGYEGLVWRQGGADSGRDIEGRLSVNNPLVGHYEEKWFFECKHYSKGVPPEELYSKLAWADAEKPQHVVLFASSYLTNNCRTWLEKVIQDKPYKIHILEGKNLKSAILAFPDIVSKYFVDKYTKLLLDARNNWLIHNILPDPETFAILAEKIDPSKLSADELGFLWCASRLKNEEIDEWCLNNEYFSLEFLLSYLAALSNTTAPVISPDDDIDLIVAFSGVSEHEPIYNKQDAAELVLNTTTQPRLALYSFVRDSDGEGLEVLIEQTSDYSCKIRYITENAGAELQKVLNTIHPKKV